MNYPAKQTSDFNGVRDSIVRLRCLGNSYETIAKTLGITYKAVKVLLDSEFKDRFQKREEIKLQTVMQLDYLIRPLLERFEETIDRRDAEAIVKIIDRKCRLLGLDEAVKVDVRQVEALTDDELEKELARHGVVKQLMPTDEDAEPALPEEPVDIIDAEFSVNDTTSPTINEVDNGESSNGCSTSSP